MKKTLSLLIVAITILTSCMKNESGKNDNSAANVARMQAFYDQVMNAHNVAMVDSFVTPDFVDHQAMPGATPGAEGLKAMFKDFMAAYPDLNMKANWIKSCGDTVITHMTMTGTNEGPFMGMPATGKKINIDGIDIVILKDGKATEHWGYQEDAKMMAQLGMGQPADSTAKK